MPAPISPPGERDDVRPLLCAARAAVASFSPRIASAVLDELAQEAVLRWLSAEGIVCSTAFVRQVARNLAVDHLRRRHREGVGGLEPATDPWPQIEARFELAAAFRRLSLAPRPHRELLEALARGVRFDDLVEREVRRCGADPADALAWGRVRDRMYKRRARARTWMRRSRGVSARSGARP